MGEFIDLDFTLQKVDRINMIQMEAASVNLYRADSDWKYES